MKNSKKILSILAVSPLFISGLVALGNNKAATKVDAGTLYSNDGSTNALGCTSVDDVGDNKALSVPGGATTGSNINVGSNFDTDYTFSVKVKGAAEQTVQAQLTFTCALNPSGYGGYTTLTSNTVTLSDQWQTITMKYGFKRNADGKVVVYEGGLQNPTKTTVKDEAIASIANLKIAFVVSAGENILADDLQIVGVPSFEYDYEGAVYYNDFDGESAAMGTAYGSLDLSNDSYSGGHSLIGASGSWSGDTLNPEGEPYNATFMGDGNFYEFSAIVRAENEANTTTTSPFVQIQTWACDPDLEGGWEAGPRMTMYHYNHYAKYNDWTLITSQFCLYSTNAGVSYAYSTETEGYKEDLVLHSGIAAGKVFAPMCRIELEGTNGVSVLYDNVAITPISKTKDAVITVKGISGASIEVWKDGEKLATQPQIDNEGEVFTVKNLSFANCAEEYDLKVVANDQVVESRTISYIKNTALVAQYDATITVKDEEGNAVPTATLTVGEDVITENNNGVFTITGLTDAVTYTVGAEGYIDQEVTINDQNNEVVITLREPRPVVEYVDDLMVNGGFESAFSFNDESGGQVAHETTTVDSTNGSKSLLLSANVAGARGIYRLADGATAFTEKEYRMEAMVKAANEQTTTANIGGFFTCHKQEGWGYIDVVSDWATLTQDDWTLVTMTFKVTFDSVESKVSYSVNGGAPVELEGFVDSAAFDIRFGFANQGDAILVDDLAIFEMFDAEVVVIKDDQLANNATFTMTDNRGNETAVTPEYNSVDQTYKFSGLYSEVLLVATVGDKTFRAVKVNKDLAENQIEISQDYKITLTLVADTGERVTGAIVRAVKGLEDGELFTEVGNGVYELEGVMGAVQIIVNKTGYDFERTTVTAANATLTLVGINLDGPGDNPESESKGKGCGGSIIAASALVSTAALLGVGLVISKRKED